MLIYITNHSVKPKPSIRTALRPPWMGATDTALVNLRAKSAICPASVSGTLSSELLGDTNRNSLQAAENDVWVVATLSGGQIAPC
jgi:hypothetical protein